MAETKVASVKKKIIMHILEIINSSRGVRRGSKLKVL
jgi:hypothetical protein